MSKAPPAFQFYPSDWLGDPQLSKCKPATRGVWIDLLCAIYQLNRSGILCGTLEQLARTARCRTEELTDALTDLKATGTAGITERNGNVRIVSRRMERDAKKREMWRIQKQQQRCPHDVRKMSAPMSVDCPPYLHSSVFSTPPTPSDENGAQGHFEDIWSIYPAHRRQSQTIAFSAWMALNPSPELEIRIHKAILALKASDEWTREDGRYVPKFTTFIGSRGWEAVEP